MLVKTTPTVKISCFLSIRHVCVKNNLSHVIHKNKFAHSSFLIALLYEIIFLYIYISYKIFSQEILHLKRQLKLSLSHRNALRDD